MRRRFIDGEALGEGGIVGSYVASELIEVRDAGRKGRGLFARSDIPAGTLLCVSKAVAAVAGVSPEEASQSRDVAVACQVAHSALHSGRGARCVAWLYGNDNGSLPPIDLAGECVRGGGGAGGGGARYLCIAGVETVGLDVGRVHRVVGCNAFAVLLHAGSGGRSQDAAGALGSDGSGLFAVPSLFNHACAANCDRVTVGDVMLVATTVPVCKDEELFLAYPDNPHQHMMPFEETQLPQKGTSFRVFDCVCGVDRRLKGTHAAAFSAAKRLLARASEAFKSEMKVSMVRTVRGLGGERSVKAGLIGEMRALSLSVPDGEGKHAEEVQPHLASMLNFAALYMAMEATVLAENGLARDAVPLFREAATLLRESIVICPPEGPASRHLALVLRGFRARRLLAYCLRSAGDPAGAEDERARACTRFAGSYDVGVFATWVMGELAGAEEGGAFEGAMRHEELAAISRLRGL